jgi:hypothetical protein
MNSKTWHLLEPLAKVGACVCVCGGPGGWGFVGESKVKEQSSQCSRGLCPNP